MHVQVFQRQRKWCKRTLMCVLLVLLAMGAATLPAAAQEITPDNLILWNRLGSDEQVLNSEVGPDGIIVGSAYTYEAAQHGTGYIRTATGGNYLMIPGEVLENLRYAGTIELWFKPKVASPVPYQYGIWGLLGAPYGNNFGVPVSSSVILYWGDTVSQRGFMGGIAFGEPGAYTPQEPTQYYATPNVPIHAAIAWQRDGIDGSTNTIRVYRNGDIVGTTDAIWNPEGPARDIAMGYGPDSQGYNKFVVDDIKIWTYAKTDFSDRFVETPNFSPVADANGPYTVDEGATIGLDANGSWDPNPADMLTYAWDLNQDGTFGDAFGPTPLFSAALLDGPDMRTVAVRVADSAGLQDENGSTVSIVNVAPTVESGTDLAATSGVPVALSVGYSDPGIADSHTATIDWGDGSPIMAATVTPTGAGSGLASGDHTYLQVAHYAVTVCVTDDDGDSSCGIQSITVEPLPVTIEIKPGEGATPINVRSKGVIPVAVFTTDEFDAVAVDPATLRFGPDGAQITHQHGHLQDVNDDGRLDLLVHFATQESGIACGDTEATLYGATYLGQEFAGQDGITTAGCKAKSAEELGSNPLFLPFIQTR